MNRIVKKSVLASALLLASAHAVANPEVEHMSDIEVSEYAAQIAAALENIRFSRLCEPRDRYCERTELARYGISYDDKESVQKRLIIMVGSVH